MKTIIYRTERHFAHSETPAIDYFMTARAAEESLLKDGFFASENIKLDVDDNARGLYTRKAIGVFSGCKEVTEEAWIGWIEANN